jgi:predicted O-methyltransferase YrrM
MIDLYEMENIPGWLDTEESYLLERLAKSAQIIVEIGTYHGRSTYVLATGAKQGGGHVTTIDAYKPYEVGEMKVTAAIPKAVKAMLKRLDLADVVTTVIDDGVKVAKTWDTPVDLLFIDGSHEYKDVKTDFKAWSKHVDGLIAFHDYTDHWPGVQKFIDELIAAGEWAIAERADATVVLKRVANG